MKKVCLIIAFVVSGFAFADILEDFDSLGGNDVLLEKAQAVAPESKIEIVQKRIVDRSYRNEFNGEFTNMIGGDAYLNSYAGAINYHFHLNPQWSFGARYSYYLNQFNEEAQRSIDRAKTSNNKDGGIPDVDWMENSYLLTANYYPIYGKLNFFNQGIVHFDLYGTLGVGQVTLSRGESDLYTAGVGIGAWLSQHLTARFELRYETHKAYRIDRSQRSMGLAAGSFQIGYML